MAAHAKTVAKSVNIVHIDRMDTGRVRAKEGINVLSGASARLVANLQTELSTLSIGPHTLPLTRNDGAPTCYVCCPSAAYLDYARDELRHFTAHPVLKSVLGGLIGMARPLLAAAGLDRQVQPNNWLLSTNILPDLGAAEIMAATAMLSEQWPEHAVVWRSVNTVNHVQLKARFEAAGYVALASRQVYLFDARYDPPSIGRDEKRDAKLLAQSDFIPTRQFTSDDFARMAGLYQALYLDKYTPLNPRYTAEFLERAYTGGLLDLVGLRGPSGSLDGIIGMFRQGDTLTAPVVGYDTGLPPEVGLYRRLMALALTRARQERLLYNMSGGAAAFKRNRGGVPALEYMMVYNQHLSPMRRAATRLIRLILDGVGVPLLQRFAL
jgi:hypothetical protein